MHFRASCCSAMPSAYIAVLTNTKNLGLTNADGQSTLITRTEQLKEFKEKPFAASASSNRTQVHVSDIKLRYAPYLGFPNGMEMQGATMVTIKPSELVSSSSRKETEAVVHGAFGGPLRVTMKELSNWRT